MKSVISVRDLEEMVRNGKDLRGLPADALLTPSARDFLRDFEANGSSHTTVSLSRSNAGTTGATKPCTSKSTKAEIEAFFNSPAIHDLKLQLCDIGRRLWQRAYVDGNGG